MEFVFCVESVFALHVMTGIRSCLHHGGVKNNSSCETNCRRQGYWVWFWRYKGIHRGKYVQEPRPKQRSCHTDGHHFIHREKAQEVSEEILSFFQRFTVNLVTHFLNIFNEAWAQGGKLWCFMSPKSVFYPISEPKMKQSRSALRKNFQLVTLSNRFTSRIWYEWKLRWHSPLYLFFLY